MSFNELGDSDAYSFTALDIEEYLNSGVPTIVASVADYDEIRPAFDGVNAVLHLTVYAPEFLDENWEKIMEVNVTGTRNVLRPAADATSSQ